MNIINKVILKIIKIYLEKHKKEIILELKEEKEELQEGIDIEAIEIKIRETEKEEKYTSQYW